MRRGDGLVINEGCDDGNTQDGDGCSSECEVEDGYTCTQMNACIASDEECVLRIHAVFRDFNTYDDSGDFSGGGEMILGDELTGSGEFVEATIPEEYGGNWEPESTFVGDAPAHNFGFTTEVKYWFFYDETQTASLEFLGDDDLWVFVNGVLALDLGNLHMPEAGSLTINASSAEIYDLENGEVYPIQVFHAERNPTGSSFKLTLSGFDSSRSVCSHICGDGIVQLGEECDDGVNDGGYGECSPKCVLGEYCGDGIVQDNESCDDGNTLDGDKCPSSCRRLIL